MREPASDIHIIHYTQLTTVAKILYSSIFIILIKTTIWLMKSFNNWIFIELKEFGRWRLFVIIICLVDASKRPVKCSNPFDSDAINLFASENFSVVWCLFRSVPFRSVRRRPPYRWLGKRMLCEWVSFAAKSKVADHLCACDEESLTIERWPFALISFILCWGKRKKCRDGRAVAVVQLEYWMPNAVHRN